MEALNSFLSEYLNPEVLGYVSTGFGLGYFLKKSIKLLILLILFGIIVVFYVKIPFNDINLYHGFDIVVFLFHKVTIFLSEYINTLTISKITAIIVGVILSLLFT